MRSLDTVALQSRQCRSFTRYFPEIVDAVAELDVDVALDGELVLWNEGRIDFAALQRRLHPSQARTQELAVALPAAYVVFDILALAGTDVRSKPYAARRALLEDLLGRRLHPGARSIGRSPPGRPGQPPVSRPLPRWPCTAASAAADP
jgi:ATP-dependent DNA ligase